MKIKRYTAASMRAALALVRAEQGPDAVILSSRRSDEGIEVIAAVDYDEALFADANRQRPAPIVVEPPVKMAAPVLPVAPMAPVAPMVVTAAKTASRVAPRSAVADPGYGAMQRELQDLRRLLESGLAGMTWSDKRLREPLKARVLEELSAMDIAPDVAMTLAALTPRRTSLENPSHIPLALLVKHLPVVQDMTCITGGITAVVGPTGAGKTTTIAKLAARWCMLHGSQDLALVSTDCYRIGAREQLSSYARILGAPMHTANNGKELARVLERLKSKKLILIDTAGMGPRDVRLTEQLAALKLGASRARVLLALPAQSEGHALEEIVRSFAQAAPAACLLTKVDEAASLGAVISVTLRHKLQIAYVCDGQRVPDDLHAAHQKRVWLIRAALKLKESAPPARDEAALARKFGRASAHA
ncbi:MAG TPA: flagellar biosynthesis protein FlhF [Steroidobacteraceae bacterium]